MDKKTKQNDNQKTEKEISTVIMICGENRGVGKTTFAKNLLEIFENSGKRSTILSFAEVPRNITSKILLFLEQRSTGKNPENDKKREQELNNILKNDKERKPFDGLDLTYRDFLISVAEGIRFSLDENIWTALVLQKILELSENMDYVIIDDHRKDYEYKTLKENYGGKIMRIYLKGENAKESANSAYFEGEIDEKDCDMVVKNKEFFLGLFKTSLSSS